MLRHVSTLQRVLAVISCVNHLRNYNTLIRSLVVCLYGILLLTSFGRGNAYAQTNDHIPSIYVTAIEGPSGYSIDPKTGAPLNDVKDVPTYRSVQFTISAMADWTFNRNKDATLKDNVSDFSQDLENLDVKVELQPCDENGTTLQDHTKDIEIVGIYPNQTTASTKTTHWGQVAGAAGAITDALTDAVTLNPQQVLTFKGGNFSAFFNGLVPPQPVPTQYAYQTASNTFGWRFSQFTRDPNNKSALSLLGLHSGLIIYQVKGKQPLAQIHVTYTITAKWKKAYVEKFDIKNDCNEAATASNTADGKERHWHVLNGSLVICLEPKINPQIEAQNLKNLDNQPLMIELDTVANILHVPESDKWIFNENPNGYLRHTINPQNHFQFIKKTDSIPNIDEGPLVVIGTAVTRGSLEEYLGIRNSVKETSPQ